MTKLWHKKIKQSRLIQLHGYGFSQFDPVLPSLNKQSSKKRP
jgi:hypothetical protein